MQKLTRPSFLILSQMANCHKARILLHTQTPELRPFQDLSVERVSITFTSYDKRESVSRDQAEVVTHVTFITQGRICLSWRVSLESLHTVNSLVNMGVMTRFCFGDIALIRTDGGCHVILPRWRTGVEHLSMVSAHAGWPSHTQTPVMIVTVIRMTVYGVKIAVFWLTRQSFLSNSSGFYHTLGKLKCYGTAWTPISGHAVHIAEVNFDNRFDIE